MTHQFLAMIAALMALLAVGMAPVNSQTVGDRWYYPYIFDSNISDTYQITLSSVHCLYVVMDMVCPTEQFQVSVNGVDKELDMAFSIKSGAIVTSSGKVTTRAAAVAACQTAGMVLADVTASNKESLLEIVRASPAIKMNPCDGVAIASWYGNSFADIGMQMALTQTVK
ncbi:hypothetical protein GGF32_008400 [Allomyces javanicus]|nr:hypothetical protein GGF32_008400 [Allomyces javanicus]